MARTEKQNLRAARSTTPVVPVYDDVHVASVRAARERGLSRGNYHRLLDDVRTVASEDVRKILDGMSENERAMVIDILRDVLDSGDASYSLALRQIWEIDYDWRPVNIDTFFDDPYYMGRFAESLFPKWREEQQQVFAPGSACYEWLLGGCFTGDTRIALLDGTTPTLKELTDRGGEFWTYSIDKDNNVVPGRGHSARVTKKNAALVEVVLDNGEVVRCTPDHRWMLRDGSYAAAETLKRGDSLMPLYRKHTKQEKWDYTPAGYERVYNPGTNEWIQTHRVVGHYAFGLPLKGGIGNNRVIHHRFGKLNNSPDALSVMDRFEHIALHRSDNHTKWHDPVLRPRMLAAAKVRGKILSAQKLGKTQPHLLRWARSEDGRAWSASMSARASAASRSQTARAKKSVRARAMWSSARSIERRRDHSVRMRDFNAEHNRVRASAASERRRAVQELRAQGLSCAEVAAALGLRLKQVYHASSYAPRLNHKVVEVRHITTREDVYDITVDEHHNFALASGAFVHNSIGCGKTWNAMFAMSYLIYKMTCLKNPQRFYGLADGSTIVFGVYSVTMVQASDVGYDKLRTFLEECPYFKEKMPINPRIKKKTEFPSKKISVRIGSRDFHSLGADLFALCYSRRHHVWTENGPRPITDLVTEPSRVWTFDGTRTFLTDQPVSAITTGFRPMRRLVLSNGQSVEATHNERVLVKSQTGGSPVWARVQSVTTSDYLVAPSSGDDFVKVSSYIDIPSEQVFDIPCVPRTHCFLTGVDPALPAVVGRNCMDEANFMQSAAKIDPTAKGQAEKLYNSARMRLKSRYMRPGGGIPGMMILSSSKQGQDSFLEIRRKETKEEQAKGEVRVSEFSQWEVRDPQIYTKPRFFVEIGDRIHPSRIIEDVASIDEAKSAARTGAEVIVVPGEFKSDFHNDTDRALRDIAGIATYGLCPLFRDRTVLYACANAKWLHPFTRESITLSDRDDVLLDDYFIPQHVFRSVKSQFVPLIDPHMPRFVHLDISFTGDSCGFGCSHVHGMRETIRRREDGTAYIDYVPEIYHDFMLRISPPDKGEIAIGKIRSFIVSLRDMGLPIRHISADDYQSRTLLQDFRTIGFEATKCSLDRTDEPYMNYRSLVSEGRVSFYEYAPALAELSALERNIDDESVDHPKRFADGSPGRKDVADCMAGSSFMLCKMPEAWESLDNANFNVGKGSPIGDILAMGAQRVSTPDMAAVARVVKKSRKV